MNGHTTNGLVLGLIPGIILVIALIGLAFYCFAEVLANGEQISQSTDSVSVTAVRQQAMWQLAKSQ